MWPEGLKNSFDNLTNKKDITLPDILFPKITDSEKEIFQDKYSGS